MVKCMEIRMREVVALAVVIVLSQTMALWWRDGQVSTAQVSRPIVALSNIAATPSRSNRSQPDASSRAYPKHTGYNPTHPWLP